MSMTTPTIALQTVRTKFNNTCGRLARVVRENPTAYTAAAAITLAASFLISNRAIAAVFWMIGSVIVILRMYSELKAEKPRRYAHSFFWIGSAVLIMVAVLMSLLALASAIALSA